MHQSSSFVFENEGKEEEKVENKQEEQGYSLQVANQNLMMHFEMSDQSMECENQEEDDSTKICFLVLKL